MIELYFLIFVTTGIAYLISCRQKELFGKNILSIQKQDFLSMLLVVLLTTIFILFAGLRTRYNDTGNYMYSYEHLSTNLQFNILLESYGGFDISKNNKKVYFR